MAGGGDGWGYVFPLLACPHSLPISLCSDEGDEATGDLVGDVGLTFFLSDEMEELGFGRAHRDNHAASFFELGKKCGGEFGGRGGNKDCVVGHVVGEAESAVGDEEGDPLVAQAIENCLGLGSESGVALDGMDVVGKFGQESSLVSGAGADFEYGVAGVEAEEFQHEGNDVGLRNRLGLGDGERSVVVGAVAESGADEFVAREAGHGSEDAGVPDTALDELGGDHALAQSGEIEVGGHGNWIRLRAADLLPRLASKERTRTWSTGVLASCKQDCS